MNSEVQGDRCAACSFNDSGHAADCSSSIKNGDYLRVPSLQPPVRRHRTVRTRTSDLVYRLPFLSGVLLLSGAPLLSVFRCFVVFCVLYMLFPLCMWHSVSVHGISFSLWYSAFLCGISFCAGGCSARQIRPHYSGKEPAVPFSAARPLSLQVENHPRSQIAIIMISSAPDD